jgi:hypothetical protein
MATMDWRRYDRWREAMEDSGAPTWEPISDASFRSKRGVKLSCGHTAHPGELYRKVVGKVDGDFTSTTTCMWCEHGEDRPLEFQPGDRVEDMEGDKATVRETEAGKIVALEWDCRPGVTVRPHGSFMTQHFERLEDA